MLVAGVVCVSLLFQLVRDDPVWLFRPTVPNALRADRMRIDAFKAHNSPLKTNDVNQRGGVGGVSVAAECRNLHQEPSARRCLAAGASSLKVLFCVGSTGPGTFLRNLLFQLPAAMETGRSDSKCQRGWWSCDIWEPRCCRSNVVRWPRLCPWSANIS